MLEKQNHLMQTSTARSNNADSLLLSFMRLLPDRKIHGTAADRTALLPSPHPTDRTTAAKCPTVPPFISSGKTCLRVRFASLVSKIKCFGIYLCNRGILSSIQAKLYAVLP